MPDLIIACLSQKGGVGKSTLSRLIARTYAAAGWQVKIADFNVRQKTSVDWVANRLGEDVQPVIAAEPYTTPKNMKKEAADLVVADGKPDSDQSSLEIAKLADLIVVPTGFSFDDLKPQLAFAAELVSKGVDRHRILFVLNKITDSDLAISEARAAIQQSGFTVCQNELSAKTGYQMAQNTGRAVSETKYATLNEKADELASEIAGAVNKIMEAA